MCTCCLLEFLIRQLKLVFALHLSYFLTICPTIVLLLRQFVSYLSYFLTLNCPTFLPYWTLKVSGRYASMTFKPNESIYLPLNVKHFHVSRALLKNLFNQMQILVSWPKNHMHSRARNKDLKVSGQVTAHFKI